jgi:hypothetical protein
VEVASRQYGMKRVHYEREKIRHLEIRLDDPAFLGVVLRGPRASGRIWVGLSQSQGRGRHFQASAQVGEGPAELGPVQPGEHELLVLSEISQGQGIIAARKKVLLAAGKNKASIDGPPLYRLVVRGLSPGEMLRLYPEAAMRWKPLYKAAGADGRILFETLPPGRYSLRASSKTMTVRLTGSTELDFVPGTSNAVEIYLVEGATHWTSLGFVSGDVIVGVDGVEFSSETQMLALWGDAMKRPRTTLMVLRGSQRVDLTVSAEELKRAQRGGGASMEVTIR